MKTFVHFYQVGVSHPCWETTNTNKNRWRKQNDFVFIITYLSL